MLLSECPTCSAHSIHHAANIVDAATAVAKIYVGPDKASVERTIQIYMSMFHTMYEHLTPVDSEDPRAFDFIGMPGGGVLEVHNPSWCAGVVCAIHNPTEHPLSGTLLTYNAELERFERSCVHGVIHPDIDHLVWLSHVYDEEHVVKASSHPACDGCCVD